MKTYIIMADDHPHAVFSDEEKAEDYKVRANEYDFIENKPRLVYYRVYQHTLDVEPPFFGQQK